LFSSVLSLGFQVLELISVKHRARFYGFEIERSVNMPEGLQLLGDAILQPEVFVETVDLADNLRHRPTNLQPVSYAVVGELCTIANRRTVEVRTL
jgi:hypothetical protein